MSGDNGYLIVIDKQQKDIPKLGVFFLCSKGGDAAWPFANSIDHWHQGLRSDVKIVGFG